MVSCLHGDCDKLRYVAECSDRLGWDSLVEGRITHHWLDLVKPILLRRGSRMPESSWGRQFITRLHNVLHRQWTYRNAYIHYKGKGGHTMPRIQEIIQQVNLYSLTDPSTLLPRHRDLLEADFCKLGEGSTSDRLLWLADMDSALAAAALSEAGTLSAKAVSYFDEERESGRTN